MDKCNLRIPWQVLLSRFISPVIYAGVPLDPHAYSCSYITAFYLSKKLKLDAVLDRRWPSRWILTNLRSAVSKQRVRISCFLSRWPCLLLHDLHSLQSPSVQPNNPQSFSWHVLPSFVSTTLSYQKPYTWGSLSLLTSMEESKFFRSKRQKTDLYPASHLKKLFKCIDCFIDSQKASWKSRYFSMEFYSPLY